MDQATTEKQPVAEQEPKEIILEKSIARALGKGLKQIMENNGSEGLKILISTLGETKEYEEIAKMLQKELATLNEIVFKLQSSDKTTIVSDNDGSGYDFKFTETQDSHIEPESDEIILDEALSSKVISAVDHNVSNKTTGLIGFAELIQQDKQNQEELPKQVASLIHRLTTSIVGDIAWHKKNTNLSEHMRIDAGNKIRLSTDGKGNTEISIIPPQEPTPSIPTQ